MSTDKRFLETLQLKIDDEVTLLDLDERIEKIVDNEEIPTALECYGSDEILNWGEYPYYFVEDGYPVCKINFEVIENIGDENSIIKILE